MCGVSSLGIDHVGVLGNTLDKIAWQKAGIFKVSGQACQSLLSLMQRHVPLITGRTMVRTSCWTVTFNSLKVASWATQVGFMPRLTIKVFFLNAWV